MNNLAIYIKQRFSGAAFPALALFILLMSANAAWTIGLATIFDYCYILLFLFAMRIYDDLQNAQVDKGKINRIYTDVATHPFFNRITLFLFSLCILLQVLAPVKAATMALFFAVNHLLYQVLFKYEKARFVLPLLKYAFISYFISTEWSLQAVALFFALFSFDIISDPAAPFKKFFAYPGIGLSFIFLYWSQAQPSFSIFAIAAILLSLLFYFKVPYTSYILLATLLTLQLLTINFNIHV